MDNIFKNKRDRIIALAVCSVIFLIVSIIAIVTATRNSVKTAPRTDIVKPPAVQPGSVKTHATLDADNRKIEPAKVTSVRSYGNFDRSDLAELPAHLRRYNFSAGILVDLNARKVIWAKNETKVLPLASITKIMTVYTAVEEMKKNPAITLQTPVTVSRECTLQNPVRAPLRTGDKIKLADLFKYSMFKSANDASYLIAEYFGYGRAGNFIKLMNNKARDIGMNSSNFVNANGLPIYQKNRQGAALMNMSSCMDIALLMERALETPIICRYACTPRTIIRGREVANSNNLLGKVRGMTGMKTGYTKAAGYCLAFSCERNGRHLIGVVLGCRTSNERSAFVSQLLEWGFKN